MCQVYYCLYEPSKDVTAYEAALIGPVFAAVASANNHIYAGPPPACLPPKPTIITLDETLKAKLGPAMRHFKEPTCPSTKFKLDATPNTSH